MASPPAAGDPVRILAQLPAAAAALLAARMARRAALAMLDGAALEAALAGCAALETGARELPAACIDPPAAPQAPALAAVRWAARVAAQAAAEGPRPELAAAVREGLAELAADRRVSSLQVEILARSDLDLLAFAAEEAGPAPEGGLPAALRSRLPPCHPLDLHDPGPTPEERVR